jgi:hypothetical protein
MRRSARHVPKTYRFFTGVLGMLLFFIGIGFAAFLLIGDKGLPGGR